MDINMPTPREVAKFVAKSLVAGQVAQTSKNVIGDHTSLDHDGKTIGIVSGVIGWYVSEALAPLTDKLVDKTADFIVAKRAERKARKNKLSEDEK